MGLSGEERICQKRDQQADSHAKTYQHGNKAVATFGRASVIT
jgi:hypothetical protein